MMNNQMNRVMVQRLMLLLRSFVMKGLWMSVLKVTQQMSLGMVM